MAANSRFAVATHVLLAVGHFQKRSPDHWVSSEFIASSVNTNPVVVRRVLGDLKRAGLVASQAGKMGGARLARRAETIKLSDIWEALGENEPFAFNPNGAIEKCPVSRSVTRILHPVFHSAESALKKELGKTRLSELLQDIR